MKHSMSGFLSIFLDFLIKSWFKKSCDSIVVVYHEPTTLPCISWYQRLATFLPWRKEDATEETSMQVLVLCMSTKKQHVMND